jgi:chloramphenicol 3-O phosphotransferase
MLGFVPTGQIIFLNGTSSSGKTSIAEELLVQLPTPYFYIPFDAINAMRSRSRTRELEDVAREAVLDRTRLGHLHAVASMAKEGNDVIVDQVLSRRSWFLDCIRVFNGFDVLFVGVRCSLPELERRESLRGDRDKGQAARQFPSVHEYGTYDVECDTESASPAACASSIVEALTSERRVSAFSESRTSKSSL